MTVEKQVEIMEKQLTHFDTFPEKVQYLSRFFDPDPEFSQEARDIVRSNLASQIREYQPQELACMACFGPCGRCQITTRDATVVELILERAACYLIHEEKEYRLVKSLGRGKSGKQWWYLHGLKNAIRLHANTLEGAKEKAIFKLGVYFAKVYKEQNQKQ